MRLQITHDCSNRMMLHGLLIFVGSHYVRLACRGDDGDGGDGDGFALESSAAGNLEEPLSRQQPNLGVVRSSRLLTLHWQVSSLIWSYIRSSRI